MPKHATLVWVEILPESGSEDGVIVTVKLHVDVLLEGSESRYVTVDTPVLNVYVPI